MTLLILLTGMLFALAFFFLAFGLVLPAQKILIVLTVLVVLTAGAIFVRAWNAFDPKNPPDPFLKRWLREIYRLLGWFTIVTIAVSAFGYFLTGDLWLIAKFAGVVEAFFTLVILVLVAQF